MSRVFKRGTTWYADFTYKGRRVRKSVGRTKKAAELALKDLEIEVILGKEERKKVRFNEFAKKYLAYSKASKAESTYKRDELSIRYLSTYFKNKYLDNITTYKVEQYKSERLNHVHPATVNRELGCLRNMYNQAIRWKLVKENPVRGVKFLKEKPRLRYLSREEIHALLRECTGMIHAIVMAALHTGMRRGELMNLKWPDVDMVDRRIRVIANKTNSIRFIPINDQLFDVLVFLPRYGEYVFSKEDGRPYGDFKRSYNSALKRAGIENFTFHDLRHTFASQLVMAGVDIRTVQELLGHKDIRVTMRYAHLSRDKLEEAVKIFGSLLAQASSVQSGGAVNPHKQISPCSSAGESDGFLNRRSPVRIGPGVFTNEA